MLVMLTMPVMLAMPVTLTTVTTVAMAWPRVAAGAQGQPAIVQPSLAPWRRACARPFALAQPVLRTPVRQPGLGLGLGLAGTATLGVGMGLLIQHRRGYQHFEVAPQNTGFVAALNASTSGAALVGSGVGLATAAVTAGLGARDRWLWTEVGVGGGVALIGAAWYAREWQRVQRDLYDGGRDSSGGVTGSPDGADLAAQRRETASAAVLGAGTGLMLGAAVALLTRSLIRLHGRRHDRGSHDRRAFARGLTGGAGLSGVAGFQLHGRF